MSPFALFSAILCFISLYSVEAKALPVLRPYTISTIPDILNDTVIYIGHAQALTRGLSLVPPIIIGNYLWQDKVNAAGGILLKGKNYTVQIITIDLGFQDQTGLTTAQVESRIIANITSVWNEFVKPNATGLYGRIDFTVSPYSSSYSPISSLVSERARQVQVSGGSSATGVYSCVLTNGNLPNDCTNATFYGDTRKVKGLGERRFFYSVGTRGLANNYYPDFITLMKIKQAQTIGVFYENVDFGQSCAVGLNATAKTLKMNVTYYKAIPSLQTANISTAHLAVDPVVDELVIIKPDVVVTCGYLPVCSAFVEYAYLLQYTPKAAGCTISVNQGFIDTYGSQAEYFSGPIGWDSRLKGPGYDESRLDYPSVWWDATGTNYTSSELYSLDFLNATDQPSVRTGNLADRYEANDQSVSNIVAFYIIHQSILNADSTVPEVILPLMNILFIKDTIWGPIQFNNNGANIGKIYLNLQMLNLQTVARSSGVNTKRALQQSTTGNITLEIVTPLSAATVEAVYPLPSWQERVFNNQYLKAPAEIGVITVTSLFLLITLVLMVALVFLRNTPQIKSSSFVFCELILFGGAMVYASMYFWTIFTYTPLCNIQVWLFIFGIDIFVGSLLAKNIRLFYIFKNAMKLRKVKPIENWQLLLMVIALMAVDAVVIIIWEAAFPIKAYRIAQTISKPAYDYVLCGSAVTNDIYQTAFIATLGALKAILLIVGVVLSLAVRKQPSEFNESRTIAFAIYNQAFCLICLLAIWLAITDDNYTLKYILRSFVILWGNTVSILVIFGRKLYYIVIGKNKAFKGRGSTSNSKNSSARATEPSKTTGTDNS